MLPWASVPRGPVSVHWVQLPASQFRLIQPSVLTSNSKSSDAATQSTCWSSTMGVAVLGVATPDCSTRVSVGVPASRLSMRVTRSTSRVSRDTVVCSGSDSHCWYDITWPKPSSTSTT